MLLMVAGPGAPHAADSRSTNSTASMRPKHDLLILHCGQEVYETRNAGIGRLLQYVLSVDPDG